MFHHSFCHGPACGCNHDDSVKASRLFSLFSFPLKPTLNWCLWQEKASNPRGRTLSGRSLPPPRQVEVGEQTLSPAAPPRSPHLSSPSSPSTPLLCKFSELLFLSESLYEAGVRSKGEAQGEEEGGAVILLKVQSMLQARVCRARCRRWWRWCWGGGLY